tara:strand:- start:641 stop:1615 length:975 start_codon:yes stop_codon:yes gene_type:complete
MAFLDNSGDIILDAVLTDTGRKRLAQGDGSFRITQFAFGDDEINYELYNKDHASGSAYYDLEILQTPVLEAFTNNTSLMKSKLLTIARTNILFLPVIKLNTNNDLAKANALTKTYVITVDKDTHDLGPVQIYSPDGSNGVLNGFTMQGDGAGRFIKIDQGLDTEEMTPLQGLSPDLREDQYIIELDNRLGTPYFINFGADGEPNAATSTQMRFSFVDDDNIASYIATTDTGVYNNPKTETIDVNAQEVIRGPRGTMMGLKIKASQELTTSTHLFTKLGSTTTNLLIQAGLGASVDLYYLDTIMRITGMSTGYSIDVPLRFIKKQ